jgi:hypothetical protein
MDSPCLICDGPSKSCEHAGTARRHCGVPGCCHLIRNCPDNACVEAGECITMKTKLPLQRPAEPLPVTLPEFAEKVVGVKLAPHQVAIASALPTDKQARKDTPITSGVLDYFTAAIAEIARVSKAGNDQHNPGQPLHWARGKSMDHADCIVRHLIERGTIDEDGMRHSAKMAWRALALLQQELEDAGAPMSRASVKV